MINPHHDNRDALNQAGESGQDNLPRSYHCFR